MSDQILHALTAIMASPWLYLALFGLAVLDAFFPVVPSEAGVVTAGVFAATTQAPHLFLVVVAAAAGALIGDHVAYGVGRFGAGRLIRDHLRHSRLARSELTKRLVRRSRLDTASVGTRDALHARGGVTLVLARYIPGGRTAVTMTMGAMHYPARRFLVFDALAALSWALYCTTIGFAGGATFRDDPLRAVLLGTGLAVTFAVATEVVRLALRRRRAKILTPSSN